MMLVEPSASVYFGIIMLATLGFIAIIEYIVYKFNGGSNDD